MRQPLIIDTPSLQSLRQRYGYAALTLAFWVLWVYLWLPLVSLIAWGFGVKFFYHHMVELNGFEGFIDLVTTYGAVILILGGSLISWAVYNRKRFRGKENRKAIQHVGVESIAQYHNLRETAVQAIRGGRCVTLSFEDDGAIAGYSISADQPATPVHPPATSDNS